MPLLPLAMIVCVAAPLVAAALVLALRVSRASAPPDSTLTPGIDVLAPLANAMPQIVWTAGTDGTLLFINDCWFEYTGQPRAGASWVTAVHPEDLVQLERDARAGRATGEQHKLQYRVRHARDGAYRWQRARVTPMRDARGRITAWWGVATDVQDEIDARRALEEANEEMERRVAERTSALAAERTFLAAVLDSLNEGIVACDEHGEITLANRAMQEMLNLPPDMVRIAPSSEYYTVLEPDGVTPTSADAMPLARVLRGEELRDVELVLAPTYARSRILATNGRRIIGDDERPLGAVIAVRDITAHREAERALGAAREHAEAAERSRREFVARLSREVRTPLDAIVGLSDVLRRDAASRLTDIQAQLLGRLGANARHLVALVEDLHDLCDVEAGRATMLLAPTRVEQVVADVVEAHRDAAAARGLKLDARVGRALAPITTDAARLRQVLSALVANAVQFTVRGAVTVTVVADPVTGVPASVEVHDTGVGISAARQRSLFAPESIASEAAGEGDGAAEGVGLAITRSLCKALRYELAVASELGVGSIFTVTFPADEPEAAHRAA